MILSEGAFARYVHVLDHSQAPALLHAALRTDKRGRKAATAGIERLYLFAGLIATDLYGVAHVAAMHRALSKALTREQQVRIGFLEPGPDGLLRPVPIERFYYVHKTITTQLNFGAWLELDEDPQVADAERLRRRDQLDNIVRQALRVTRVNCTSTSKAMDATGTWSFGRARHATSGEVTAIATRTGRDEDEVTEELSHLTEDTDPSDDTGPTGGTEPTGGTTLDGDTEPDRDKAGRRRTPRTRRKGPYDPEAGHGVKTGKNGKDELFYGYDVHALVGTSELAEDDFRLEPLGIDFFTVTPANVDVVEPSLRVIDRYLGEGNAIEKLAVDRHYSYKRWERWRKQLRERGIKPVHDLRKDEHGFTAYDGMKLAAAWPHCGHTPDTYARIDKPGPTATPAEWDAFYTRIEERRAYAFRRNATLANGTTQWICCGRAGTVGCPKIEGSVEAARDLGLPIIVLPEPAPAAKEPRCCTNATVTIKDGPHMKLYQDQYWGSVEWTREWNLRTLVEGFFGNAKNPSIAGMDRGYYRGVGVAHVTLAVLFAAIVTNIHLARTWHTDTDRGDESHIIYAPEPEDFGVTRLTREQAQSLGLVGPPEEDAA